MFMFCEAMKWSHLPNTGGLYDQDPDLLDGFMIIFSERSKHEAQEQAKRDRESQRNQRIAGGPRVAGRRR